MNVLRRGDGATTHARVARGSLEHKLGGDLPPLVGARSSVAYSSDARSARKRPMSDQFTQLFDSLERGLISRRQLLQAFGVGAVIRPVSALAQGTCGGANASLPRCDKMPAKLPFEST